MPPLSREEFEALRSQGVPMEAISRMDADSLRAEMSRGGGAGEAPAIDRIAPYLAVGGGLAAGGAAVGLGVRAAGRSRRLRTVAGQAGRELIRDRGPVGSVARIAGAAMRPEVPEVVPPPAPEPTPVAAPEPVAPRRSSALVTLTEDDIANIPQFRNARPGEEVRRSFYEVAKFGKPGAAPADVTAPRPSRRAAAKPAPKGPKGGPRTVTPAESEAAAAGRTGPVTEVKGKGPPKLVPGSRHEVQYYSESKGSFVPIETMHISELRNALNKLHRKLTTVTGSRPSPVQRKQFQALKDEITYRAQQAGELTVPGPVGRAQNQAATEFADEAIRRQGGGRAMRGIGRAGGAVAGIASLLGLLATSRDVSAAARGENTPLVEGEEPDLGEAFLGEMLIGDPALANILDIQRRKRAIARDSAARRAAKPVLLDEDY